MKRITILVVLSALLIGVLSCASLKRRDKGAIIGAGAYIGNYMDKQAEEMERDLEGAKIERIGEGIKITFASGILFDVGKSAIKSDAQANLQKLATILNKYEDTEILAEGHTDATGSEDSNMDLSIRRAHSVSNYLQTWQVLPTRMHIQGYGETQPIASNETVEGKQLNRRVEIAIFANDKLKKVAKGQG